MLSLAPHLIGTYREEERLFSNKILFIRLYFFAIAGNMDAQIIMEGGGLSIYSPRRTGRCFALSARAAVTLV